VDVVDEKGNRGFAVYPDGERFVRYDRDSSLDPPMTEIPTLTTEHVNRGAYVFDPKPDFSGLYPSIMFKEWDPPRSGPVSIVYDGFAPEVYADAGRKVSDDLNTLHLQHENQNVYNPPKEEPVHMTPAVIQSQLKLRAEIKKMEDRNLNP
jgi:hypothetical protein